MSTAAVGRRLHDDWRHGAEAYLGTVVPGYPNLFTLYGPNTNGITSMIYILEAQAEFVRRLLDTMSREAVEGSRDQTRPARRIQYRDPGGTGHHCLAANCSNYLRHPSGKMVTQYPYSGSMFDAATRRS